MGDNLIIQKLQQEIQDNPGDVKAEVQLVLALEKGMQPDQFITNNSSGFRREYSPDISKSELREDANGHSFLEVYLSRTGIYDQLPEGLFFSGNSKRRATVADLSADYKQNKRKEAGIRKFFQPIEHDFFFKRLDIEEEENLLLEGLQSGVLNDHFIQFWNLPVMLPRNLSAALILLLPYSYKIAGDLELMSESLRYILNEAVQVTKTDLSEQVHTSEFAGPALGEAIVGLDLVAGTTFYEDTPAFKISIGPLRNSSVSEYLEGESRFILLSTFERFFIPAGTDMVIDILVDTVNRNMTLLKKDGPVLGYSSYI